MYVKSVLYWKHEHQDSKAGIPVPLLPHDGTGEHAPPYSGVLPQGVQHGLGRTLHRVDAPPGEGRLLGHEPNAHRLEEDRGTLLSYGSVVRPAATITTAFTGRVQEVLRQDRLLSKIQSETRGRIRHLHRLRIHMGLGAQGVDTG